MATRLICDATGHAIPDGEPDAGAGPMLLTTEEGFRVRVEVLPDAEGNRPNLLRSTVTRWIAEGELVPEDEDAEEGGMVRLPRRVEG